MYQHPQLIKGNNITDDRGKITFNNEFNTFQAKRIYFIENHSLEFIRGWQGHKIEQRWFICTKGAFEIKVIKIRDWEHPSRHVVENTFQLNADNATVLHVPHGHVTSIQALELNSKLMAMSDYLLGEINDEYRFDIHYFKLV